MKFQIFVTEVKFPGVAALILSFLWHLPENTFTASALTTILYKF